MAGEPVRRKPAERWQRLDSRVVAVGMTGNARVRVLSRGRIFKIWWFTWFWHKQLKGFWCSDIQGTLWGSQGVCRGKMSREDPELSLGHIGFQDPLRHPGRGAQ